MTDLNAVGFALEELFALRLQALSGRWPRMCAHRGLKGKMTQRDKEIAERLALVKGTLSQVCTRTQSSVELVAVSKTFPAEAVLAAALAGQSIFGENYAQEGCAKVDWFKENHPECKLVWHFIGPLQANKTRPVAERFDWVDSVDRLRIAKRLNDQRPEGLPPLNVLIEVNISAEESKSGVMPEELQAVAREIAKLPRLKLRGLMAIPEPAEEDEAVRSPLRAMKALFDAHKDEFGWDTLSMGMSADMVQAVEEGATMVRVGRAIFGARHYPAKA